MSDHKDTPADDESGENKASDNVVSFHNPDLEGQRIPEDELRNILDNMQDTYYRVNNLGQIVHVSRAIKNLLGYEPEELIGQQMAEIYADPLQREDLLNGLKNNRGVIDNFQTRLRRKDGSMVWISVSSHYIRNEHGVVVGIEGSGRNIEEQKKAELLIHEREAHLRLLTEQMPAILWTTDDVFSIVSFTGAGLDAIGVKQNEVIGRSIYDFFPSGGEDQQMVTSHIRAYSGETETFELALKTRTFQCYIEPLRNEDDSIVGVLGFALDITDRKLAEARMRKLSRAIEQTADSVVVTDCDGIVEYVNKAFEQNTGYSAAEVIGQKSSMTRSGKHSDEFYADLWNTILAGKVYRNVLINKRKDGALYHEEKTITPLTDDTGNITHFISTGKDITERLQVQERLKFMAHHDALTGLPNRVLFTDRLEHALDKTSRQDSFIAVMFLDMDRFKIINDTLGHDAGDEALCVIARRISECVRNEDTVARLGGDEFAILLEGVSRARDSAPIARKILNSLSSSLTIEGHELFITTSIGISLYPTDGNDSRTLLKHADIAMYRAKEEGRNSYQFYSSDMSAMTFERLNLETSLRHALQRQEFVVYYQPQVDMNSDKVISIEALLRWQHPDLGIVYPGDFIPLLEDTGMIVDVGEWVMREACRQCRQWNDNGHDVRVSVNISSRQFGVRGFTDGIRTILRETGLPSTMLDLEITETVIIEHCRHTMDVFRELQGMDITLTLDDFGTGYSSLSYLKRIPIKALKIDGSFVRDVTNDEDDAGIVRAIIGMAKSLHLEVIAEGVETRAQGEFLRNELCDAYQGNYFSSPVTVEELGKLLSDTQ
ncbi:MAG: hypothetical protein BMS9Abin26_1265 [Gammaproteobacteria bacterium]|nr:MAG: hypothetical protein BMS9Abin26_1265 [Gammaproteobacteria bacterium]